MGHRLLRLKEKRDRAQQEAAERAERLSFLIEEARRNAEREVEEAFAQEMLDDARRRASKASSGR